MTTKQADTLVTTLTALVSYVADYLLLNPESLLNWASFRTAVIGAVLAYTGKNRKKIIAAIRSLLI